MAIEVTAKWETGAKEKIEKQPGKILYTVASILLDKTYPTIPLSTKKDAGKLRQTSKSAGVRGEKNDYYIGSYTDYAKSVYKMNNDTTNWSTPGTNSEWYDEQWEKDQKNIVETAIGRNPLL